MRAAMRPRLPPDPAAPGSDDTTMTERDGRAPEDANEPVDDGADAALPDDGAAEELEPDEADLEEADDGTDEMGEPGPGEAGDAGLEGAEAEDAEAEEPDQAVAPAGGRGGGPRRVGRRGAAAPEHAPTPSELAVRIDDRISKIFVAAIATVFALIFLYALLLGRGGLLTPKRTPAPVPVATPAASITPAPTASAGPSISAPPSASPTAPATPAPSATASP